MSDYLLHHRQRHGLFTSESVSAGHPDKICDRISDTVLDTALSTDPSARVAVEAAIKGHEVFVFGETKTHANPDIEAIVLRVLADTGHAEGRWGLNLSRVNIRKAINQQSAEIASGVGEGDNPGAGDQGMMFGYACDETPEFMPLSIAMAHRLIRGHQVLRQGDSLIGPDAKSQVTVRYDQGVLVAIDTVVLSTQHSPDLPLSQLRERVREEIIVPVLGNLLDADTKVLINPAGTFHAGGPAADAGLTGRKIIVDTYGGMAPHGGGAFSGKDPTKVDRSGAYAARQLARDVVTRGWAGECEVRVAYAIGKPEPVAVAVDAPDIDVAGLYREHGVDLRALFRPGDIIRRLDLCRPIYARSAVGGHFGRPEFPWESSLLTVPDGLSIV